MNSSTPIPNKNNYGWSQKINNPSPNHGSLSGFDWRKYTSTCQNPPLGYYEAILNSIKALFRVMTSKNPDKELIEDLKKDLNITLSAIEIDVLQYTLDQWDCDGIDIDEIAKKRKKTKKDKERIKRFYEFTKEFLKKVILKKEFLENIRKGKKKDSEEWVWVKDFTKGVECDPNDQININPQPQYGISTSNGTYSDSNMTTYTYGFFNTNESLIPDLTP